MKKVVAVAFVLAAFAQPALACGGSYRAHTAHVTRVPKIVTKSSATAPPTLPAQVQTSAINSADQLTAQCKKYFPNVGSLVAVPCSS